MRFTILKLQTLVISVFVLVAFAQAKAQTPPVGNADETGWCLDMTERLRVEAAYAELRVARQELQLYALLDAHHQNAAAQGRAYVLTWQQHTTHAQSIAARALLHNAQLASSLDAQAAQSARDRRARRGRIAAWSIAGGAVALSVVAFQTR